MLLHRHRVVGAAFDSGVVGDDDRLAPVDDTDAGGDAGRRRFVVVKAVGGKRRQLEKGSVRIDQCVDALARQELTALVVAAALILRPTVLRRLQPIAQLSGETLVMLAVFLELRVIVAELRFNAAHRAG